MNSNKIMIEIAVDDKSSSTALRRTSKEIEDVGKKAEKSLGTAAKATDELDKGLGGLARTAAAYTAGFIAVQGAVNGVVGEFKRGLSSVEDFNVTVASSAALITTFSEQARRGDLAGAFQNANEYAGQLAQKLEMIDSKTIASGKDLQTMSETMLQYGVILDINNQKQVDGFTNIATALKLVTAGQNQDIQMRQEINALLMGQIRATDRLPKLLQNIDPELKDHLEMWKQEGTLIENVGRLLEGFSASTGNLDELWMTVGSTMETIHNRILRGAFKPMFEDLIGLAKDLNNSLMDTEGNLTPLAQKIQQDINGAYQTGKELVSEYGGEVATFIGLVTAAKTGQLLWNAAINASPIMKLVAGLGIANEGLKNYNLNLGNITKSYSGFVESSNNVIDVITGKRDANTGEIFSEQEQALRRIAELKKELSGDKEWYQFQLFADPVAEKQHIAEVNAEIERLQGSIESQTEMERERARAGGEYKAQAIDLVSTVVAGEKKKGKAIRETETITIEAEKKKRMALQETMQFEKMYGIEQQAQLRGMKDSWQVYEEGRVANSQVANEEIEQGNAETTSVIIDEWSNAYSSIQSTLADWVYAWEISWDSIVDVVRRAIAEIIAAIAMGGIKGAIAGLFNGSGFLGGLSSGIAGAIGLGSGAGGAAGAAGAGLSLAGIGSKIGGWLGIGGGAGAGAAAGLAGGSGFVAGTGAGVGGMAATAAAGGTSAAGGGIGSIFAGGTMAGLATAAVGIGAVIALISAFGDRAPTIGEQLNAMNVSAQQLISAGLDEEFRQLDAATKELIPALDRATGASYNAATGILTTGSEIYAMAEAANMGSESLLRMNYKLNESTGAWEASATIITKWQQEMQAASGAAETMSSAVSSMGSATSTAAGRIAGAASDISSILDGARRMSSHLVGGPGTPSYHAAGGIITSPVRWGGHVLGESGPEGIVPLPEGPGTLSKIIDRLDRLEAKQTVVQVFIGNEQIDGRIRVVADRLDADRVGGGRRYIS